mgnify:CR=1 FL=1
MDMVTMRNSVGLRDWLIQRVTAVILVCYLALVLILVGKSGDIHVWQRTFQLSWIKWVTLLAMLSLCWHAWIGLWTIFTDYVKHDGVRRVLEVLVLLLNLFYVLWVIKILWW